MRIPTLFASVLMVTLPSSANAESWWRVLEPEGSHFAGGHADEDITDPAILEFLALKEFDEWEVYEDEIVKLRFPKHPLLKLKVNGGEDGIKVEGGVCTTVDNSFARAYELKAGEATYGVFLLSKSSWLDDGICMCGPMVHHVYQVEDGCLARFSLLPGGAVKKAQLLGGKLRLMSFEWTHLACPQEIYEEMVESMVLKTPNPWSEERLRKEVARRYGMEGRSGWLHPGVTVARADEIMGRASTEDEGKRTWLDLMENYPCKLEAIFKNGKMESVAANGVERTGEEASIGSIDWAEDRLEKLTKPTSGAIDPFAEAAETVTLTPTPEDLAEVVEATVKISRKIPEEQWWRCVHLMAELSRDHQIRDERFTSAILTRGKGTDDEAEVLRHQGYAKLDKWIVGQLKAMQLEAPSETDPSSPFDNPVESRSRDARGLVAHLAKQKHPQVNELVEALFRTKEPAWLLAAINTTEYLKPSLTQDIISEGMERAIEQQSGRMIEVIFDQLDSIKLEKPEAIMEQIDRLPSSDPGGKWEEAKKEAKDELRQMKGHYSDEK